MNSNKGTRMRHDSADLTDFSYYRIAPPKIMAKFDCSGPLNRNLFYARLLVIIPYPSTMYVSSKSF